MRPGPGLAGRRPGGGHRPGRELPGRDLSPPRPRHPGGRPVPRGESRPTGASTRSDGESRTRPSVIEDESTTRCIGSASSSSRGSERLDETGTGAPVARAAHRATPTTSSWVRGWPKNRFVTSISPTIRRRPPILLDKAIVGCPLRRRRRDPLPRRHAGPLAQRDLEPSPTGASERTDRGSQLLREAGQASRTRLHLLRALPAPGTPAHRWCHMASASVTAQDQNPLSPR